MHMTEIQIGILIAVEDELCMLLIVMGFSWLCDERFGYETHMIHTSTSNSGIDFHLIEILFQVKIPLRN